MVRPRIGRQAALLALILVATFATPASFSVPLAQLAPFGPPAPAQAAEPRQAPGPGDGAGRLTLLHNNDGESSLLPIPNTVRPNTGFTNATTVTLATGGAAAFKTLTLQQIQQARTITGNAVLNVYAGDAFLASSTLLCSLPPRNEPVYDAIAQRQIPYDAHIFGNHEFDYSPDFLLRFIEGFRQGGVITQPFLSANLTFTNEVSFTDLIDADGIVTQPISDSRVIGRSAIITDTSGQRYAIVGATTPALPTISSPRNVQVTPDITTTARVVQAEIDKLTALGIRKVVFVSHLQSVSNDRDLIAQLRDVDIAVAGGGDELLASTTVPTVTQLLPGESAPIAGSYPLTQTDAAGNTVYIVTTAGNYKYLGRLDVEFDAAGAVTRVFTETSYPRRVVPTTPQATTLGVTDAVISDTQIISEVITPVVACQQELAATGVATTEVLLDVSRNGVRGRETNVGNLVADAFVNAYDRLAPENGLPARGGANRIIAIQNGGGIRQNAGDQFITGTVLSRLDTFNVLPFDNFVTAITDVTPLELKAIFERSGSTIGGGQFLQISGISVTYDLSNTVGSRVRSLVLADGTPIVKNGGVALLAPNVTIVTNQFTASGGDDYAVLASIPESRKRRLLSGGIAVSYEQVWREYLQGALSGVVPANDPRYRPGGEGRIRFNNRYDTILNPILRLNASPTS
jgi:2',3'-cyclic-nucleotide 2'-phosphodiesterase / 3'-nucleotidase / 5'-nucleotidase